MDNNINRISVYGDSILKGAVTGTESGRMFEILEENSLSIASKKLGFELNNQSVFGSFMSKTIRRFNKDLEKGVIGDLAIIESGGNDCDYDWATVSDAPDEPHDPRTKLDDFISMINEIVTKCRENKITPLIMTMPALVPERWFEHIVQGHNRENILKFLNGQPTVLYQNHERYNIALLKYCYEKNVQFVDMRMKLFSTPNYRDLMCQDGIHPNQQGYNFMATVWEKELPEVRKEFN